MFVGVIDIAIACDARAHVHDCILSNNVTIKSAPPTFTSSQLICNERAGKCSSLHANPRWSRGNFGYHSDLLRRGSDAWPRKTMAPDDKRLRGLPA